MPQTPAPFDTARARQLADEYGGRLHAIVHQACDEIDTRRAGCIVIEDYAGNREYLDPVSGRDAVAELARRVEKRLDTLDRSLHAVSGNSAAISRRVDDLEDRIGPVKLTEAMPAIHERLARLEMPKDAS